MYLAKFNRRRIIPIATAVFSIGALIGWTCSVRADHSLLVSAQVEIEPTAENASPQVDVDLLEEILQPTPQVVQNVDGPSIAEPALPRVVGPPTLIPADQPPTSNSASPRQPNMPVPDLQPVRRPRANAAGSPANLPAGPQVKIFSLSEANAFDMAQLIRQLLEGRALRAAADGRTNSLIVVGTADEIAIIEAIVSQLDRTPARSAKTAPASKEAARMKEAPIPQGDRYPSASENATPDKAGKSDQMSQVIRRQEQAIKELKTQLQQMSQRAKGNSE